MYTDAAKHGGLGYVLTQPQDDGEERIIYCGSTGLSDSQRQWSMGELEMAAVVYGLTNACHFTYGAQDIQVFSDHSPLVGLSCKCLDDIENPCLMALFTLFLLYSPYSRKREPPS